MNKYESPLGSRYASEYMLELFSNEHRSIIWRKLWISLAKAEKKLGLDITDEQIKELEDNVSNIDYDAVKAREINTRPISAKEIGGIHDKDVGEKEYYSEKEVDAMTPEQQRANYEAILRSMSRWK